jgi:uncharacterized membrane protein YwaF
MKKKFLAFLGTWDYIFMYIIIILSIISSIAHWNDTNSVKGLVASLTLVMCCGFIAVYRKIDTMFDDDDDESVSE